MTPRQHDQREKYRDAALVSASLADGWALLRRAQRALERAKRIGSRYAESEEEAEREQAAKVLAITGHVDSALALMEGE